MTSNAESSNGGKQDTVLLSSKVEQLMSALDQVKKYKILADSMIDFVLIVTISLIVALFVDIAGYLLLYLYGYASGFFTITPIEFFIAILIVILGAFVAITVVSQRVNRVPVGEWRKTLQGDQSVPGTLKILSELDWQSTFKDIQVSRLGFMLYGFLKVVGYWLLLSFVLFAGLGFFVLDEIHISANLDYFVYLSIVALVIVLAWNWGDLKRRFNQVWSLDTLLWELRWFDSEFRRAESEFKREANAEA